MVAEKQEAAVREAYRSGYDTGWDTLEDTLPRICRNDLLYATEPWEHAKCPNCLSEDTHRMLCGGIYLTQEIFVPLSDWTYPDNGTLTVTCQRCGYTNSFGVFQSMVRGELNRCPASLDESVD